MLELFGDSFGDAFRADLKPRFMEFQDKLGEINDHATAGTFFQGWIDGIDGDNEGNVDPTLLHELLDEENRRLDTCATEFRQWWTPDRVDDLEQRFERLLEPPSAGS